MFCINSTRRDSMVQPNENIGCKMILQKNKYFSIVSKVLNHIGEELKMSGIIWLTK